VPSSSETPWPAPGYLGPGVSFDGGQELGYCCLFRDILMGFRLALASAGLAMMLLAISPKALACDPGGNLPWLGTTAAFTSRLDDSRIRPGGLIGAELGLSFPIEPYEHGRCPLIGIGAKFFYSGNWIGALPLRISYPVASKYDVPMLYLQVGPALHLGIPGVDVETGLDWIFAAVFVGATWLPDGDDRGSTVMVGARLSLLFCAWWLAVQSSGGFTY